MMKNKKHAPRITKTGGGAAGRQINIHTKDGENAKTAKKTQTDEGNKYPRRQKAGKTKIKENTQAPPLCVR